MTLWQEEVRRAQQSKSPVAKKSRVLEFSEDSDGKQSPDYSKRESSDEDLKDEAEDSCSQFGFREKDIVWVQLEEQEVNWPALVQEIYPASGQVSVQLIDLPAEDQPYVTRTVYPIKQVITFNQADQNIRFLEETKSKYDDSIVKVMQRAEDYMRKKLLGEHLDEQKLFGGGRTSAADSKQSSSQSKAVKINNHSLLRYIKSGKIDAHLLGVYNESIKSERHANFKANLKAGGTNYGPFNDFEDDREELFNYLKELFKSNSKVDSSFDVVGYLLDVLVPEVRARLLDFLSSLFSSLTGQPVLVASL